tara:strand:+ start:3278 stop:3721 length:444 start_codon:yes stop_codon:yes gene_type:complete
MAGKWDDRFLALAEHVSAWSKDPSTKCGAVIVDDDKRVLSVGYNGFPRGVEDNWTLLSSREEKYSRIIHAEINAILFASGDLRGATLYSYPLPPCAPCAAVIIQKGIRRVVSCMLTSEDYQRWGGSAHRAAGMFEEAGVILELMVRR